MYYFTCQAQEIAIYRGFNLISTLLGKIHDAGKMATIVMLVTSQPSTRAAAYKIYLRRRSKAFH